MTFWFVPAHLCANQLKLNLHVRLKFPLGKKQVLSPSCWSVKQCDTNLNFPCSYKVKLFVKIIYWSLRVVKCEISLISGVAVSVLWEAQ